MKFLKRLITLVLLLAIGVSGWVSWQGYQQYQDALGLLPMEEAVEDIRTQQQFTPLSQVPKIYHDAVVAVEDRRFYLHDGFDVIGTTRALIVDLKARKLLEGGSTITQQLAKNIYFPMDNTPQRKIAEIFMAMTMEKRYSKEELLELYINTIYYGSGYYTIYDAAMGYFGKPPSEMTDYECTLLVGIPNAPSVYSLDVNPELAMQRQEQVVEAMVSCGYLYQAEAAELLN